MLAGFKITGLFGDRDIYIPFENDTKILIGENGLGKTTVLNILYYVLINKPYKLKAFNFTEIELSFVDGSSFSLTKETVTNLGEDGPYHVTTSILEKLSSILTKKELNELSYSFSTNTSITPFLDRLYRRSIYFRRYPAATIVQALKIVTGYDDEYSESKKFTNVLNEQLAKIDILYFPTFRRIEEDLISLGFSEEKASFTHKDARLIQFGMQDVKERLDTIKSDINALSTKGLQAISSEILSQLVRGEPVIEESDFSRISTKDIQIILARLGEAISPEDKVKIMKVVSEKRVNESENKYLVYFLQKLINIYEQQREIDDSIENFVFACNKYLQMSDKEILYEANSVDFYLANKSNGNKVLLNALLSKLSSGEKQIISLFAKIHLSGKNDFIVLFDEPELSLSINWQKLLLPDIVSSEKCKFLLSVTHSPFIFDNELEEYAVGLNQYINLR